MAEKDQHINYYTAEDIQRYLDKKMTPAEMHAFEKASLEDPFLAEALEGYIGTPIPSVAADINELKERFAEKDNHKPVIPLYRKIWWSAAASILVLLGVAFTWFWLRPSTEKDIAQQKTKQETTTEQQEAPPAAAPALADTITKPEASATVESDNTAASGVVQSPAAPATKVLPVSPGEVNSFKSAENKNKMVESEVVAAQKNDSIPSALEEQLAKGNMASNDVRISDLPAANRRVEALKKETTSIPTYIFKGKITDEQNKPLPFVNLNIPGTATYAYSDANGNFTMMSGDTQMVVYVKSVGYEPKMLTIHATTISNNIVLAATNESLPEVIATGYGTRKKGNKQLSDKTNEEDDIMAEPVDGWGNYDIYLLNNERATAQGFKVLNGMVELSFVVNQYGHLSEFEIARSTCQACEKEAIRLIKEGPRWKLLKGTSPAKVEVTLHF